MSTRTLGGPVLVTGGDGQLGRALAARLSAGVEVVSMNRAALDLCDHAAVTGTVARLRPTAILNCAAYNDVDGAEDHAVDAFEANAFAVRSLAAAAERVGAALVHYSTDFVFDGTLDRPYTEEDAPSPQSVYAASKLVGEWFAPDAGRWFVLRVESLFGTRLTPGGKRTGSVDKIIDALEARQPVRVFRDRTVSPSYLPDVAAVTAALLSTLPPSGIYHVVNDGYCTWLELALEIARHVGGGEHLVPISVSEAPLRAARPRFAALSPNKIAAAVFAMPTWQHALERYLTETRRDRDLVSIERG